MRWFALLTLFVLSATGCAGSNAEDADATGTIAFVRGNKVWVMRADGSGQRALTLGGTPEWSPDGRRIAYVRETQNTYDEGTPQEVTTYSSQIFVSNADGSGRARVSGTRKYDYESDRLPVWSPDGRTLAFEGYDDGDYTAYVVGADGSRERSLLPGEVEAPGGFAGPSWSGDGRTIALTNVHEGAVYVIRPDGRGGQVLARMEGADAVWGVAWSPDGRRIAFIRDSFLWVMNADGTRPRMLVDEEVDNPGARASDFAWSPDGRTIAFAQRDDPDWEIYVVDAEGRGLRKLTDNDGADDLEPVWSPDGRAIAFTSTRDGNSEIYVMDADGSDQRTLSDNPADDFAPAWSARG
jgi:Tol biopolymer transport system component